VRFAVRHLLAALALLAPAAASPQSPVQGDRLVNVVRVSAGGAADAVESAPAAITVVIPVAGTIELLQYAPGLPGARPEPVVRGAFRTGAGDADPLAPQAPPRLSGADAALDLSAPLALAAVTQLHQGDPLFIRVADRDQDLDRTLRETVLVTLTDDRTGDVEVVQLTEDGPDTGVFVGYVQTARSTSPAPHDGVLAALDASHVTARYVDPDDGTDVASAAVVVDPFGLAFDSQTGLPVNGASLTVIDVATGQPAQVLGDDGVSTFPATVTTGGTAQDSSGRVYTFEAGGYRFPFLRPGTYRYQVAPPAGYRAPSTVPTATLQALPGAPFVIVEPGSRGEAFTLAPGPALRIDVPLDPAAAGRLVVQKAAGKPQAAVGDVVPYQVDVTNPDAANAVTGVRVVDQLPVGFRYRRGSAQLGGVAAADPRVSADGRTLTFELGTLAPSGSASIRYVVAVGAGARVGAEAVNVARASGDGGTTSNAARAVVRVVDELLSTKAFVLGRVTTGACDARDGVGDKGVPAVRVVLEDGTWVMTDRNGLYHFEGLTPGTHVVQVDLDSLPPGYEAVACTRNDRFAGRDFSQFVDLQGGTAWRADFHLAPKPAPAPPAAAIVPAPPPSPRIVARLRQELEASAVTYEVLARGAAAAGDLQLEVTLPEGLVYEPGSSAVDGAQVSDTQAEGRTLRWALGPVGPEWSKRLTLRASAAPDAAAGERQAEAVAVLTGATTLTSEPSRAALRLVREAEATRVVLHPHFASLSDRLSPADLEELRRAAGTLERSRPERLVVVGYTDDQRIRAGKRAPFADNQALSLARAQTVARTLAELLHLAPERSSCEGRGEADPVASNATPEGRAQNRRVEVTVFAAGPEGRPTLQPIEGAAAEPEPSLPDPVEAPPPAPAPPPAAPPAPAAPAATPVPAAPAEAPRAEGLVSPVPDELVADKVVAVQARLHAGLAIRLAVDGKEVPSSRIGYKREDPATGFTDFTFVGVDLGEQGAHTLLLAGRDPFGNERFRQEIRITRVGEIASVRLVEEGDNVADGKTPIRLRFELRDAKGDLVRGATRLQIREGALQGYRREADGLADADAARRPYADKDGWALFQPVGTAGPYRAVIAAGVASVDVETWVKPRMRDWILVGLAEGSVGHDVVKGNLQALEAADASAEDLWKGGRVAFYAKGQVLGKWLVTAAVDSGRKTPAEGQRLFQTIDPNQYYTVYGDATQQGYDAASARKIYLRIEREQFYALFGDYDTGLTTTELSRYSRRLNGVKAELQTRHLEANGFAARTDQAYVKDEIPGDGTSGLYHLSRRGLTLNSEVVTVVARDRFHPERVVSSQTMVRFVDYAIDYEAGTLFFNAPIASRDDALDPITIVVEYECQGSSEDYTAGGRVGVKLLDRRLRAGVTAIHEGQGERRSDLAGVDAKLQLGKDTQARAELATSEAEEGGTTRRGDAWLGEVQHTSHLFDVRLYLRQQEAGFGLGQQPAAEAGSRKFGLDGALRLGERFGVAGQAYKQDYFASGTSRAAADVRGTWRAGASSAYLGLLDATDTLQDDSRHHSGQVIAGGKLAASERLTLGLDYAQSAWGDGNVDYPTRVAGRAEYKLTSAVTLVGVEEVTFGHPAATQNTRLGLQATPWQGASAQTSVERQVGESAERVLGNVGLRQTFQLTPEWKVDGGMERAQTVEHTGHYRLAAGVVPASGATAEDFTAMTAGAAYQRQGLVADARLELRLAASEDKWVAHAGTVAELASGWGVAGKAQLVDTRGTDGARGVQGDLRLGLVYRPPATRWIALERLDLILERRRAGTVTATATGDLADAESWRLVENAIVNYRPTQEAQVSVGVGVRYVRERIAGRLEQGFSDQLSAEGRYDVSPRWDVGARGSVLSTWATGATAFSAGPSVGYSPVTNAWVSIGFNVLGYRDRDFSAAEYTAFGPYLKVRFKFDQQSIVELGRWVNSL
jgi:uncharacterized repeat protein (TIGR01451 family)